ncbi:MAG TPA: acetolactate decarboxylase [Kiritimatiellia bacterium]|nr:acetolactate decarboxylase [Kiritimatiellia bacterium]HNR93702.1 acetolactate decarboxylase [Kiritimatiellia bacterium]HNS81359.1 acetolactate decarboxylase [Kiritimatiellia bacterium]HPA78471.1 acetolactate decarboxylase [Kiritimatiellia bacterium]HQQ04710.1 acetolactate decarboxylase [Kiritimatiellia bacterium]
MKNLLLAAALALLAAGCATTPDNTVFQMSTIDALLVGVYDGHLSGRDLLRQGNFGIGTFEALDGEMVVLDGRIYQVKADGSVVEVNHDASTPFASVCFFNPDIRFDLTPASDFAAIEEQVNRIAPNQNLFCAVRISGKFKSMHTRSVPRQQKPYPPLKQVTARQPEFFMEDIEGDVVGFRCPEFVKGVNVPGFHLHFISRDRTQGGHILGFELAEGRGEVDLLSRFHLQLPQDAESFAAADLSRDRSEELHAVEK